MSFDGVSSLDSDFVTLNEIHVDMLEYLKGAELSQTQFRSIWPTLEWENKVQIETESKNLKDLAIFLAEKARLTFVSQEPEFIDDSFAYFNANLAAESSFGETLLVNMNMRRQGEQVNGYARIRSQSQGICFGAGEVMSRALNSYIQN